jgi:solute carrier family 8 (sodium/calcium exchanger)
MATIMIFPSACCGLLLLLLGLLLGALANEIGIFDLGAVEPALNSLEEWFNDPRVDPELGGEHCSDGWILYGPARTGRNTLLFMALLCWTFLGIAIAADVFMAGIEQITSTETTRTIALPSGEVRRYTVTVWNGTVANLTLMALGSSSPEILLSIFEIVGSGFYVGELGPSAIVGSAAFNMLIISAVCITAIPDGGQTAIKALPVFYITGVASLFAYVWLIIMLVYITPDVVDVWEGVATFVMFPLLVYVAYRADVDDTEPSDVAAYDDAESAEAAAAIGYGKDGKQITKTDISRVLALKSIQTLSGDEQLAAVASMLLPPQSQAYYRKAGMNAALGNKALDEAGLLRATILEREGSALEDARGETRVQWVQAKRVRREGQGSVTLAIVRNGDKSKACSVEYCTKSGTATDGVDFEHVRRRPLMVPKCPSECVLECLSGLWSLGASLSASLSVSVLMCPCLSVALSSTVLRLKASSCSRRVSRS